jgi:Tfp pilus assembly protein PilN
VRQKTIVPVPAVTSDEAPRLTAVSSALGTRIAWDRILREFSLVLPDDVKVSALTMSAPDPADATTGAPAGTTATGFSITGTAFSHDGVARLLSRLMLIPDLENVTLGNSTADPQGGDVQFSITASVRGAVAPAAPAPAPAPAPTDTTTSEESSS